MNFAPITRFFGKIVLKARAKSPELLLLAGGATFIGTVILASKETLKFQEVLEEHNMMLEKLKETEEKVASGEITITAYSKADAKNDRRAIYLRTIGKGIKTYAPAIGLGLVSLGCFAGAVGIVRGWLVGAVALNTQLQEENHALEEAVISEYGAEKLNELKAKGCGATVLKEEDPETGELKVTEAYGRTPEAFAMFFDSSNPSFNKNDWKENMAFLERKLNLANHIFSRRGYIHLNEVVELLEFEDKDKFTYGNDYGWIYYNDPKEAAKHGAANYVSFGIEGENGVKFNPRFVAGLENVPLLRFNCDPEPINNKIGWLH